MRSRKPFLVVLALASLTAVGCGNDSSSHSSVTNCSDQVPCADGYVCVDDPTLGQKVCVAGEGDAGDATVNTADAGDTGSDTTTTPADTGADTAACTPTNGGVEICDGLDNNCDDSIDENLSQDCYTGPDGTKGVGLCAAGAQACTDGAWAECSGEVTPSVEVCGNSKDEDCDGASDDWCAASYIGTPSTPGDNLSGKDWAWGVTTDKDGNVYVTGYIAKLHGSDTSLTGFDVFLTKYDATGQKQWARDFGSAGDDEGQGVTTDSEGNVYVTGWTQNGIFGDTTSGGYDIFVVRYSPEGTRKWYKLLGGSGDDKGTGIASDGLGGIYVSGYTDGDIDGQTNNGAHDAVLAKFNATTSEVTKVTLLGTDKEDAGEAVATDASGKPYLAGWTEGELGGQTSNGGRDAFVAQYDTDGATNEWVKLVGSDQTDQATDVAVDSAGGVYVSGRSKGDLGGAHGSGTDDDGFVAKVTGSSPWTTKIASTDVVGPEWVESVAVNSTGTVFAGGWTKGQFDGVTRLGTRDGFVALLDSADGSVSTIKLEGSSDSTSVYSVADDHHGSVYMCGVTKDDIIGAGGRPGGYTDAWVDELH